MYYSLAHNHGDESPIFMSLVCTPDESWFDSMLEPNAKMFGCSPSTEHEVWKCTACKKVLTADYLYSVKHCRSAQWAHYQIFRCDPEPTAVPMLGIDLGAPPASQASPPPPSIEDANWRPPPGIEDVAPAQSPDAAALLVPKAPSCPGPSTPPEMLSPSHPHRNAC